MVLNNGLVMPPKKWDKEHDARLKKLRASGMFNDAIAEKMGFSPITISVKVKALDLPRRKRGMIKGKRLHQTRNSLIVKDAAGGMKIPALASKYDLTPMRIKQILKLAKGNGEVQ